MLFRKKELCSQKRPDFPFGLDTNVPFLPRELIRGKRSGGGVKEKEGWGRKAIIGRRGRKKEEKKEREKLRNRKNRGAYYSGRRGRWRPPPSKKSLSRDSPKPPSSFSLILDPPSSPAPLPLRLSPSDYATHLPLLLKVRREEERAKRQATPSPPPPALHFLRKEAADESRAGPREERKWGGRRRAGRAARRKEEKERLDPRSGVTRQQAFRPTKKEVNDLGGNARRIDVSCVAHPVTAVSSSEGERKSAFEYKEGWKRKIDRAQIRLKLKFPPYFFPPPHQSLGE